MSAHRLACFPKGAAYRAALAARADGPIAHRPAVRNAVSVVERINQYGLDLEVVRDHRPVLSSHATGAVFTGGPGRDKLGKGRAAKVLAPSTPQAPGGVPAGRGECHPRETQDTGGTGISPCKGV